MLAIGVALLMTMVTFRDVWLSRFTLIPGDGNDGRLNAFFLEHSWGWISRRAVDSSLWGLPIYFPHGENALAYSDAMVSFGPLYWPWRALGLQPDVSYALWCMSVVAVGAMAGYLMLRLAVGLSPAAAAIGSWLVAASASRIHQISHSQLLPVFYVCAGLAGVVGWVGLERPGPRRASAALAAAALVAQLYGGFYQGFFLALAVAVLGAVALVLRDARREIWRRLRADWLALLAIAALTVLALWPWARHYGAAQSVVGSRGWAEIEIMVPRPATWLYMSPGALAYEWTQKAAMFRRLPWHFEHAVGIGLLTSAMFVVAAVISRRRLAVELVVFSVLVVILATTMVDGRTLWKPIVEAVPSFGAARAISRVGLLFPIGTAVVLGVWADGRRGRARAVALVLMAACAVEQLAALDTRDRDAQRRWVAAVARRVDRDAAAFVVSRSSDRGGAMPTHLDAMYAAQITGVPTVNGASGNDPPGWYGLQWARVRNPTAERLFREALESWVKSGGVDPKSVQWIRLPPTFRNPRPHLAAPRAADADSDRRRRPRQQPR